MRVMRDLVGATLSGRYTLVARIAGGGMGEVYRAHDVLLDRPVAVKILQHSLANDPALVERFRQEARSAARLNHPNIVAVHDWGAEDDATYYMVMEYVSGTDLRDVLVSRGTLQHAQAVQIMASVCDALTVAHRNGLVHRDIKPENVLLARDGTVKVADFGIAAVVDQERTMPGGNISGTLRYLSPEQAAGRDASYASDIWAAGAVLSELLTGLPPNQGAGAELLQRRATEPLAPPSEWDPSVPADLDEVVARACAVDPVERYQDASEMAMDLRRVAIRSLPDAAPLADLLDDVTTDIKLPDIDHTVRFAEPPRPRGARLRALRRVVALAIALALVAGAAVAVERIVPDVVDVPKLAGLSLEQAQRRAEAVGLEAVEARSERTLDFAKGEVIEQSPAPAAELEEGSTIELVTSAGPPLVRLPDLTGTDIDKVGEQLEGVGLDVGRIEKRYSLEEEGTILAQRPRRNRVEMGSQIHLVVSKGPRPVEIPSVAGLKKGEAVRVLEAAGVAVTVTDAYSDEVEPGFVIVTEPAAGVVVDQASTVTLYVSVGPRYEKFKMPDVRNMSVDAAVAKLESMGLIPVVRRSCPGETVVDTDPLPGVTVREQQKVALFVC